MASGFECGWCDRSSGMTDTCSFTGDCPARNLATIGMQCPVPTITDFDPKFGPPEGGTTINITGTDLGVSFSDFDENSIQVGRVNCMPTNPDGYLPGRRISCTTTSSGVSTSVVIMLSNGNATSGETLFTRVSPQVTRVFPSRGPQAGGTKLTVYGTNLNIGNTEDTRITLVGGTECTVK
jgi:plexin A